MEYIAVRCMIRYLSQAKWMVGIAYFQNRLLLGSQTVKVYLDWKIGPYMHITSWVVQGSVLLWYKLQCNKIHFNAVTGVEYSAVQCSAVWWRVVQCVLVQHCNFKWTDNAFRLGRKWPGWKQQLMREALVKSLYFANV